MEKVHIVRAVIENDIHRNAVYVIADLVAVVAADINLRLSSCEFLYVNARSPADSVCEVHSVFVFKILCANLINAGVCID